MKNLQLKIILKYLRPYKKEFLYGALALLIVNILSVVIPLEVKNIIDQLQNGFSSDFVISKSLWLIFLATCMGLIRLFSRQIVFGIGRKVEVNLRQKLFDHLLIQDPEWIQKKGSGDIISRATSDVENIRRLLGFTVLSLCNIVLAYSFTIPSMFSINKTLTIKLTFIISILALASAFFIEHALGHQPCNLCILERIPYLTAIIIIVLNYKFIHLEKYFILLLILIFLAATILSLYHLGIEQGFIEESLVCDLKKGSDLVSKEDILKQLQEKNINCKDVTFKIMGLSLTSYNILISLLITISSAKIYLNYDKN